MKRFVACCALSFLFPIAAHAYEGYVVADVNLRAGPDVGYPPITMLPAGAPVAIQGCIQGWTWCDVVAGYNRGWVAGTYLQEAYRGSPVIVTDYGASIGIPVVAFSIGAYWGHYYRDRPWYHDRVRWEHHSWGYRAPPRPTGWSSGHYHTTAYSGQVRGAVTTPTHRTYSGYRTTGTASAYRTTGTTHYRATAAAAPRVQQRPPVNSRATTQRNHAYAQQRAVARTAATQPRAVAHAPVNAPRAHAQQARATEGHGRAVHESNARRSDKRDHGNDQH